MEINTDNQHFDVNKNIVYSVSINYINMKKYILVYIEIVKQIADGSINIQEKICNLGIIKPKRNLWFIVYDNITKNAHSHLFGHIPNLILEYLSKYAKVKYFELLHYSKKNKLEINDVIGAVNKSVKMMILV